VAPDRVDVALLVDRLRRDLLAAMPPDDVLEDVAEILGLVERGKDRIDRARADLVTALDELGELVDARACATFGSSPSIVRRLPRSSRVIRSRSRSASSTPSPTVASSAATSLETERTSCTQPSVGAGLLLQASFSRTS
jgi:hypothetical protein